MKKAEILEYEMTGEIAEWLEVRKKDPSKPFPIDALQRFLNANLGVSFDSNLHLSELLELWSLAYPGEVLEGTARPNERWKMVGFQGTDPVTDLRGMGMLSVRMLIRFARRFPSDFHRLLARAKLDADKGFYPFACVGIALCAILVELMHLRRSVDSAAELMVSKQPVGLDSARCREILARSVEEEGEESFAELFCVVFSLFDRVWTELGANYMQFSTVVKATEDRVKRVMLQKDVSSARDVARALDVRLT